MDPFAGDLRSPRRERCMPALPTPRLSPDQRGAQHGLRASDQAQAIGGIHSEMSCGCAQTPGPCDFPQEKNQPVFRVTKVLRFRDEGPFPPQSRGDH